MQPNQFQTNYSERVSYYQREKDKCAQWRISRSFFRVLRAVYKLNLRVSKAARAYQYNRQYAWRVIKRLRVEGLEQDIIDFFKTHNDPDYPEIEFWTALELRMKEHDIEALTLYAKIRGFIK